jgi:hypothetical protein
MFYVWAFCHMTDINMIVHYANSFDNVESVYFFYSNPVNICCVTKGSHIKRL